MKTILHIIVGLEVGGAELMLKRLVEGHRADPRYRHAVISLTSIGEVGRQLQAGGVEVISLDMRSMLAAPLAFWRLYRHIRAARPDLVQTWMYHADLLGGLAARLAGVRNVVWGVRTTDVRAAGVSTTTVLRFACAHLSAWVPRIVVCAADASRRAHEALGYDARRMRVVPNGFDLAVLTPAPDARARLRAEWGIGADTVVVGSLARFNPAKDHHNFIAAAGLLLAQWPHTRFLMIGRNIAADNAQLVQWIAATGQPQRFILVPQRRDVADCLAAMDIFCLHSRTEGFPNVVGEAMSVGLPCVVTDVGDAAYLVGEASAVAAPGDPVALAAALAAMLAQPAPARARIGAAARARIAADFTMAASIGRFEQLYEQIDRKDAA